MELIFMGTAAAEGIPGIFCACETCKRALSLGGKNIMTRTQMLLDDELLIDLAADTYNHFIKEKKTLAHIENLLVTHSHIDHISYDELNNRLLGMAYNFVPKLNIYCNEAVENYLRSAVANRIISAENLEKYYNLIRLTYYKTVKVGSFLVTPLPARHALNEQAFVFLIEKEEKCFFYCNDTGIFEDDSIYQWLAKNNKYIDLISFDCTKGNKESGYYTHMSMSECKKIFDKLKEYKVLSNNAKAIVTHFSHNCGMVYDELVEAAKKYNFTVAFDGMKVNL